jgi:hypothetical protein
MAEIPYGYSYETGKTAKNWTRTLRKPTGITIHHWGSTGSSFNGIIDWFCAPTTTAKTSCHYVAQGADANGTERRRVACIVDPDYIAWHAGDWAANVATIGIECRPEARTADYEVVAELVARLWLVYGVLPLYPHKHWANTACPGKWDLAKLKTMATAKFAALKAGVATPPPAPAPVSVATTVALDVFPDVVPLQHEHTLTAKVSPSTAAGKVQMQWHPGDGKWRPYGQPITVAAGVAKIANRPGSNVDHNYRAVFTPSTSAFKASTSAPVLAPVIDLLAIRKAAQS